MSSWAVLATSIPVNFCDMAQVAHNGVRYLVDCTAEVDMQPVNERVNVHQQSHGRIAIAGVYGRVMEGMRTHIVAPVTESG
jgi:hypothetical protein